MFVQGGLLEYAAFVPDPIAMSSGEAEYNPSCAAVACMSRLHNCYFDCDLQHMGTVQGRDNHLNFPGGRQWRLAPILLDFQAVVAMVETVRYASH